MNAELFNVLDLLEKEKGIKKDYMLEKISRALVTAYKHDSGGASENVFIEADEVKKEIRMYANKTVVETVNNHATEIQLEEAKKISKKCSLGDIIAVEINTNNFGRIASQNAKQVIIQGIREAEQGMMIEEFSSKEREILTAVVSRIDSRNGNIFLEIGGKNDKTEAMLPASEQVRGEKISEGDRIKVYVVEVRKGARGPQILISRTHPGLVKRLFELEVPEIHDGVVEIMSIAREAGSRTKLAVWSNDDNVDPIGACVGPRGARVSGIVEELHGEKIDIIKYSEDPEEYIAAALSPADVVSVDILTEGKSCRVVVPDDQLSLAIGKEGQNARLAAKLTNYKIDIKPSSQV
ncbi:MAG: transcription termination factor NusA [Clostridiales bacterium]|nr:transcription termination factor NusA [Clostridiales bacterium]